MAVQTKDLLEFLADCELRHYHNDFVTKLKVNTVPQLKYVVDDDLTGLGMSKPEIRRLRHSFKKECPKGALVKIKKILAKGPPDSVSHSTISISPPILEKPAGDKHIIDEEAVSLQKIIGTGEFGYVQQGVWTKDGGEQVIVAVKCLPKDQMRTQTSEFLDEATIMHSVCHPHVVQLYGVVLGSDNFMMVTEYAPLKSLLECLKDQGLRSIFSTRHLCDLACQLADGMAYLEKNRLIHRDLAARNVLVFAEDKVKISDFGLSRALGVGSDYYQSHLNTGLKLPIAWCAPECINFLKFTSSSDVWSFGVLLWEMFSFGEQPWAGLTGLEIMQAVDAPNFQRLPQPPKCPEEWYATMNECWKHEPTERPRFADLVGVLQQMKPPQVIMVRDCPQEGSTGDEYLKFKVKNVVTVLSKTPTDPPQNGLWRGIVELTGDVGYFDPNHSSPYIEVMPSNQLLRKIKLNRTESARMSIRNAYKATPNLISRPQNDLRHLGHVGYDGVCFGDVSFIGNNYDKLPNKAANTRRSEDDLRTSLVSLPVNGSRMDGGSKFTSLSSSTLTSGYSALCEDDELADFKLPGISSEADSGSSLMEEVLKVLNATTSDHDEEMKDLLAGFENLGLSVDRGPTKKPPTASKPEKKSEESRNSGVNVGGFSFSDQSVSDILRHNNNNGTSPRQTTTLPPQIRPESVLSSSSSNRTTCSARPTTNGSTGPPPIMKKPTQPPPSVAPTARASEVSETASRVVADAKSNVNGNEEEEDEYDEEEEEEDGSLFESSSYSSSKEVSDQYNGIDDDKKSSEQKECSPLRVEGRQQVVTSPTSSKSSSLRRSSGDEKKSPSVSSAQISSPKLIEGNTITSRLVSLRSLESTDETDGSRPASSLPTPMTNFASSRLNPQSSIRANLNQKLRAPIIPGRAAPIASTDEDDPSAVDTNPLRRLRQSAGSTGTRPMMTFRPVGAGDRNLNVNAPFFDKLKEQQRQ